jgi:hypothetical protein
MHPGSRVHEGVKYRLRFCLQHFNCVKMAAFLFYIQSGEQRKVERVGNNSHVGSGKKFPGEKGIVKRCVVVMQQPVAKVCDESSHIFTQSP